MHWWIWNIYQCGYMHSCSWRISLIVWVNVFKIVLPSIRCILLKLIWKTIYMVLKLFWWEPVGCLSFGTLTKSHRTWNTYLEHLKRFSIETFFIFMGFYRHYNPNVVRTEKFSFWSRSQTRIFTQYSTDTLLTTAIHFNFRHHLISVR